MELFTSKTCIYLTGFVFFITCFLGIASDVPVVTVAIRASIAAVLCLVLSRVVFRIFIEFFAKDAVDSNLSQHTQQSIKEVKGGLIDNATKKPNQTTNPK